MHIKHHGVFRTGLVYMFKASQRLVDLDLMLVETTSGKATESPVIEPYVTRQVTAGEYREGVRWLGEGHDRQWAFDREDRCFANMLDSQLVGYQFYAARYTVVRPNLAFAFPDTLAYAYASFTHPDHRGRRLAKSRANARRQADEAQGIRREVVWYVSVDNLASRAVSRKLRSNLLGYLGYVKIRNRFFCFASPGCKRAGVSLVTTED